MTDLTPERFVRVRELGQMVASCIEENPAACGTRQIKNPAG
jgi:hypothetical protein